MRLLYCSLFLILSFSLTAQEKNSLLWEISGKGLTQSSYLYGTMHVSKKIAFRLDDVFYESLLKSDIIALESDPATWLEDDAKAAYGSRGNYIPKGFYAGSFVINNPNEQEIASYLAFEDRVLNGLLYRTSAASQDFEEETYLDMFIYQAGQKFNKQIVALEDLEESTTLVGRASLNAMKEKPDDWLQEKLQHKGMDFLIQDAYRERNINLIDSLDSGIYTGHYLKNMLYLRNHNMVAQLDSIIQENKVFAGIGAAHLPGKNGVLELLRTKGYTVKPLISKITTKSERLKEKIENTYKSYAYSTQSPDDNAFSVLLPNKLYAVADYNNTGYIAPDLANGSYVMVSRIPTFSYLKQDKTYDLDKIDDLLFENIPGKIFEKIRAVKEGAPYLDIKNVLKNGDQQRYQIYITPLEIIIFKMGGKGTYVTQYSDTIFNSIQIREDHQKKITVHSGFQDFSVEVPSNYIFPNKYRAGDRLLQAVDTKTGNYFFLRKVTQNDLHFIEEDTFELRQIQHRFYQHLKLKPKNQQYIDNTLISKAIINDESQNSIHLKTAFKGGEYYLLGAVTQDTSAANSFFNSFKMHKNVYSEKFKTVKDTALYFTTKTSVNPPKFSINNYSFQQGRQKPKEYNSYTKTNIYKNKNGETISVTLNKAHDYLMLPSIDSVWSLRKKLYARNTFKLQNVKNSVSPEGYEQLQLVLTDTASTRGILVKNIAKDGLLYELKAVVDTLQSPSKFITEFYENFKPTDTVIGRGFLEDKTTDFFTALKQNDSIIIHGHRFIYFQEKHLDSLQHYIANFNFKDNQKNIQAYLIQQMGSIKNPKVEAFFNAYYEESYNNSAAQTKILQAVSSKADKASVSILLHLMSKDLPLVSNKTEINKIFKPYLDSLPLAKQLFPKILDYSAIAEYKEPIFSLLANLKFKGLLKVKSYKKYKNQILNDAKIQLKRHLGQDAKFTRANSYVHAKNTVKNTLEDYVVLLFPFRKETEVQWFFNKLLLSKDPMIKSTYAALLAKSNGIIPNGIIDSLAANPRSRKLLFDKLNTLNKLALFPKEYSNQKSLSESAIHIKNTFNTNEYSVEFVAQKDIEYKGKNYRGYFYKYTEEKSYNPTSKMYLLVYDTTKKLGAKPFYENKGRTIEDIDSDAEMTAMVTEEFLLKDRKRAAVYRPEMYNNRFGYYGY
ncbi:TraB/GumN family protein [Cellulophaga sp. F20128]|uniref:TraB/GumN family protein n=1 Tax=Cellulophaga sp. F20128 TaxID=2926413 RepID=UPI001FF3C532|nr:TraB/GumN family protein [Cellulophaga sp. F20128]MCK0155877.1 TraB/GumN family protein [Cellulophaga sp. F20128]